MTPHPFTTNQIDRDAGRHPAVSFLVVHTLQPGCSEEYRLSVRERHFAFVRERKELIEISSRTHSPDGSELTGGFFLLSTDDPDEVEAFITQDPYCTHGVWAPAVVASVVLPTAVQNEEQSS